jgi:hypothetical protein
MSDRSLITTCPACGHRTSAAIAGRCTVIVPGPTGGPMIQACGCNCYKALTGKDMHEEFAELMWGKPSATEDSDA